MFATSKDSPLLLFRQSWPITTELFSLFKLIISAIACVFLPKVYLLTLFGPTPMIPLIPPVPNSKSL